MRRGLLCVGLALTALGAVAANRIARIGGGADIETRVRALLNDGVDYDAYVFCVKADDDKTAFSRAVGLIREARPDRSVIGIHPRGDKDWKSLLGRLVVTAAASGETPEKEKAFIDYIVSVKWGVDRKHPKYLALSDGLRRRTQRLHDAKWGVFNHFLGHGCRSAAEWNARVNGFDVKALGERLTACGAKFYFITLMQGRRWMLAPNATFDRICGTRPGEACATRDLVRELADELTPRGIDLYLYYTGDGPYLDPELGPKMGLSEPRIGGVDRAFVANWASVLEEYAVLGITSVRSCPTRGARHRMAQSSSLRASGTCSITTSGFHATAVVGACSSAKSHSMTRIGLSCCRHDSREIVTSGCEDGRHCSRFTVLS